MQGRKESVVLREYEKLKAEGHPDETAETEAMMKGAQVYLNEISYLLNPINQADMPAIIVALKITAKEFCAQNENAKVIAKNIMKNVKWGCISTNV